MGLILQIRYCRAGDFHKFMFVVFMILKAGVELRKKKSKHIPFLPLKAINGIQIASN